MALYRPRETVFVGNAVAPLSVDDIYAEDHPLVRQYPQLFVEVQVIEAPARKRPVEQATAAPGEQRQTRRG